MRGLSMVRRVDNLGRIVIPVEFRRMMEMNCGQDVELIVKEDTLVLKRFQPGCVFCGFMDELSIFEGKRVCLSCRRRLSDKKQNKAEP